MAKKDIRIKKLEQKGESFLVERSYPKFYHTEYVVALNYDFKSNTYSDGLVINSLPQAYLVFNDLVNKGVSLFAPRGE